MKEDYQILWKNVRKKIKMLNPFCFPWLASELLLKEIPNKRRFYFYFNYLKACFPTLEAQLFLAPPSPQSTPKLLYQTSTHPLALDASPQGFPFWTSHAIQSSQKIQIGLLIFFSKDPLPPKHTLSAIEKGLIGILSCELHSEREDLK